MTDPTGPGSVLGAILVGGRSRRMGRDKALIEIDGVALVDRGAAALAGAGCRAVVAIGPASLAGAVTAVDDLYPAQGPLGGILSALAAAGSYGAEVVIVVACDLPGLESCALASLMTPLADPAVDAVIARSDRLEPLCAAWRTRCASRLQPEFDRGVRAVHQAIDDLRVVEMPLPARVLYNVNTPDQLPRTSVTTHGDSRDQHR